jgi:hypothetical protein
MISEIKVCMRVMATSLIAAGCVLANSHAATVSIGNTLASNPNRYENFDGAVPTNDISVQFAGNGLTFTRLGESGMNLISNVLCTNTQYGVSGNYLGLGLSHPCDGDVFQTTGVRVDFDHDVEELSWTGYSRIIGGRFTLFLGHDNNVVGSFQFDHWNQFDNETVLIQDVVFNQMTFIEEPGSDATMILDHLTWRTHQVPVPGSLSLLGLGLAGLAWHRKRATRNK